MAAPGSSLYIRDFRTAISDLVLTEGLRSFFSRQGVIPLFPEQMAGFVELAVAAGLFPSTAEAAAQIFADYDPGQSSLRIALPGIVLDAMVEVPTFRFVTADGEPSVRLRTRVHIDRLQLQGQGASAVHGAAVGVVQDAVNDGFAVPQLLTLMQELAPPINDGVGGPSSALFRHIEFSAEFNAPLVPIVAGRTHSVGFTIPQEGVAWALALNFSWLPGNQDQPYGTELVGEVFGVEESNGLLDTPFASELLTSLWLASAGLLVSDDQQPSGGESIVNAYFAALLFGVDASEHLLHLMRFIFMAPLYQLVVAETRTNILAAQWNSPQGRVGEESILATEVPLTEPRFFCPWNAVPTFETHLGMGGSFGGDIVGLLESFGTHGIVPPSWKGPEGALEPVDTFGIGDWLPVMAKYEMVADEDLGDGLASPSVLLERLLRVCVEADFGVLPELQGVQSPCDGAARLLAVRYTTAYSMAHASFDLSDGTSPLSCLPMPRHWGGGPVSKDEAFAQACGRGTHLTRIESKRLMQAIVMLSVLESMNTLVLSSRMFGSEQPANFWGNEQPPAVDILQQTEGACLNLGDLEKFNSGGRIEDKKFGIPYESRSLLVAVMDDIPGGGVYGVWFYDFWFEFDSFDCVWNWGFTLTAEELSQGWLDYLLIAAFPVATVATALGGYIAIGGVLAYGGAAALYGIKLVKEDLLGKKLKFQYDVRLFEDGGRVKRMDKLSKEPKYFDKLNAQQQGPFLNELIGAVTPRDEFSRFAIDDFLVARATPKSSAYWDAEVLVLGTELNGTSAVDSLEAPSVGSLLTPSVLQQVDSFTLFDNHLAGLKIPKLEGNEGVSLQLRFDVPENNGHLVGMEAKLLTAPVAPVTSPPSFSCAEINAIERVAAVGGLFAGRLVGDLWDITQTNDSFVAQVWRVDGEELNVEDPLEGLARSALDVQETLAVPAATEGEALIRLSPLGLAGSLGAADLGVEFLPGDGPPGTAGVKIRLLGIAEALWSGARPAGAISVSSLQLAEKWCQIPSGSSVEILPDDPHFFDWSQGRAVPIPIVITQLSDGTTCLMKVVLFLNWHHELTGLQDGVISVRPMELLVGILDAAEQAVSPSIQPNWEVVIDGPTYVPVLAPSDLDESHPLLKEGAVLSYGYTHVKLTPLHHPTPEFPQGGYREFEWFVRSGETLHYALSANKE